ncbi:hypothetical protein H0H87_004591, partial [Tephrocybe sp. NHM501043]
SPRSATPRLGKDVLTHSMGGEGFWRAMEEGEERTPLQEGAGRGLEQRSEEKVKVKEQEGSA